MATKFAAPKRGGRLLSAACFQLPVGLEAALDARYAGKLRRRRTSWDGRGLRLDPDCGSGGRSVFSIQGGSGGLGVHQRSKVGEGPRAADPCFGRSTAAPDAGPGTGPHAPKDGTVAGTPSGDHLIAHRPASPRASLHRPALEAGLENSEPRLPAPSHAPGTAVPHRAFACPKPRTPTRRGATSPVAHSTQAGTPTLCWAAVACIGRGGATTRHGRSAAEERREEAIGAAACARLATAAAPCWAAACDRTAARRAARGAGGPQHEPVDARPAGRSSGPKWRLVPAVLGCPAHRFGQGCSAREARGEHRAQSTVRCRRPGRSWHPSARSSSTRRRSASRAPLSARCVRCGETSETRPPMSRTGLTSGAGNLRCPNLRAARGLV